MNRLELEFSATSYLNGAIEIDKNWSFALQLLPLSPAMHERIADGKLDRFTKIKIDLFTHCAKEIASATGLDYTLLVEVYDKLLFGRLLGYDDSDSRLISHHLETGW